MDLLLKKIERLTIRILPLILWCVFLSTSPLIAQEQPIVTVKTPAKTLFSPFHPKSRPFVDSSLPAPKSISKNPPLIPVGNIEKWRESGAQQTEEPLYIPPGSSDEIDDYDEEDLDEKKPSTTLNAQPVKVKAIKEPTISLKSHSVTAIEVDAGNKLLLEAQTLRVDDHVQWYKGEDQICTTPTCEMTTLDWGVGHHQITLLVFNQSSSLQIFYDIKVSMTRLEADKKEVVPAQVPFSKADILLTPDNLMVRSLVATAYRHGEKSAEVVSPIPHPLLWEGNTFRTDGEGIITLGKSHKEQHYILSDTDLVTESKNGVRILNLNSGRLRSRQLDGEAPGWSILGHEWVQIDTDGKGDVVTEYRRGRDDNDIMRIINLRGFTRVLYRTPESKKEASKSIPPLEEQLLRERGLIVNLKKGLMITMPPGTSLTLTRKSMTPPVLRVVSGTALAKILRETTPEYFDVDWWITRSHSLENNSFDLMRDQMTPLITMPKPKPRSDIILPMAKAQLEKVDPFLALELLLPYAEEIPKNYDLALLTGIAYRQLGQYDLARRYLDFAAALDKKQTEPTYQRAMVEIENGRWNSAMGQLWKIRRRDPRTQEREYYTGVSRFQLGEKLMADRHFNYSLWSQTDPMIARSASEYIKLRDNEEWLILSYRGTSFWTSNIFHQSPQAALPPTMPHPSSPGNEMRAEIKGKLYQEPYFNIWSNYRFENRGWAYPELSALVWEQHTVELEINSTLSQNSKGQTQDLQIMPYLSFMSLGTTRAQDGFGLNTQWSNRQIAYAPKIRFETAQYFDPDPNNDDLLDPFTNELVSSINLSARRVGLRAEGLLTQTSKQDWSIYTKWMTTRYQSINAKANSFNDLEIGLLEQYRPLFRWTLDNSLSLLARDFNQSTDHRKDTVLGLRSTLNWRMTPELTGSLWLGFDAAHSSRADHTYNAENIGGSLGISF